MTFQNILQNDSSYFGATVGRIGNRIGGAQFTLNGIHYKLVANEGNNTLHCMFYHTYNSTQLFHNSCSMLLQYHSTQLVCSMIYCTI